MSIPFYMDEHVHGDISRALRARGMDVLTVQEDGRGGQPDPIILDRAGLLGRLLFTMDKDFLAEASRRQRAGITFVGIVFAHSKSVTLRKCIADLELIATAGEIAEYTNRVEHLPL